MGITGTPTFPRLPTVTSYCKAPPSIIAWIDWGIDVQQAVSLPHAVNRFGTYDLEDATRAADLAAPLQAMGFEVKLREINSGLHAIAIGDRLQGAADPRREGIAIGE